MKTKNFNEVIRESLTEAELQNNFTMPFFNKLLNHLKIFETEHADIAQQLYRKEKFEKGEILVNEGEFSSRFFFVESGILRSFTTKGEKQRTTTITFPMEFSGTYSNSILGVPSDITIEVIKKASIWVFDWNIWNKYREDYPELNEFERFNSVSYITALNNKINDFLFLTTYERYEKLISTHPHMIRNVPLKYIADFIGCTVENLSRIRSTLVR